MKKIIAIITILVICIRGAMAEDIGLRFYFDAKIGALLSIYEENEGPSNLDRPMCVGFDGSILKVISDNGVVCEKEITAVKSLSKLERDEDGDRFYALECLSDRGAIVLAVLEIKEKDEESSYLIYIPMANDEGLVMGYLLLRN